MRTQVAVVDVFQGVTFTPTTDWRDFRPHGRRVTWREEGSPTVWYTYVLEDDYDSEAYDLEKLEGQPIPEEYYRIPYESAWTEVKGPLRSDQFLKVVEPTRYLANGLKLTWPATEVIIFPFYTCILMRRHSYRLFVFLCV